MSLRKKIKRCLEDGDNYISDNVDENDGYVIKLALWLIWNSARNEYYLMAGTDKGRETKTVG